MMKKIAKHSCPPNSYKAVIVVSDLHCGSDYGLLPPQLQLSNGTIVGSGSNLALLWLWNMWLDTIKQAYTKTNGASKRILIVNGDAIEGIHHRSQEVVAAKWSQHLEIAHHVLTPLRSIVDACYVVDGTECHTQNLESDLARLIHAEQLTSFPELLLEVNGVLLQAKHHMTTASRIYLEAGALSTHLVNARDNFTRNGNVAPRVYLRGHRHASGYYSDGHYHFIVTGGWQFLTRHGRKVVPDSIPRPSVSIVKCYEDQSVVHESITHASPITPTFRQ